MTPDPLTRGESLVNQTRPHARHLVGDDARTDATAANGDAAIDRPAHHGTGQGHDEIRIVIVRLRLCVAKVNDDVAGFAQHSGHLFLQHIATVVGRDPDTFRRPWQRIEL